MAEGKYKSVPALIPILRRLKKSGKKIVFTNGCFDILHAGHVSYLKKAKSKGDVLIVALNSDGSVRKLKGKGRPVQSISDRVQIMSALEMVDYVTVFNDPDPLKIIMRIKPDVLVKGGDWTKQNIVGGEFVESCGGKVFSLSYLKGYSTSSLIERMKSGKT